MKIIYKLILGYLTVALLICFVGYFAIRTSQEALRKCIGESSATLAKETLDKIDRSIHHRVEQLQAYAKDLAYEEQFIESNQEFDRLEDVKAYINEKDREWTSVPKEAITPFMRELIDNALSEELRQELELQEFYKDKYGYKIFAEVFLANKYGANLAQTGKTTDYRQDDEQWWQLAKRDGLYVADVEYDRSAEVYSTDIGIRIDDQKGNFIAVMKAVLNIEEVFNMIREARDAIKYKTASIELWTKQGKLIYNTEPGHEIFEDVAEFALFEEGKEHRYFLVTVEPGEKEELLAHTHSKGYKDYQGLGWILVVEHETKEILAPVIRLRNNILITLAAATLLAILLGFVISRSISEPLMKLSFAAREIGKGNLDTHIGVGSDGEIAQLAASFKKMAGDLQQTTTSIHILNKEISERKKAEQELKKAYKSLQEAQMQLIQSEKLAVVGKLAAGVAHEINNPLFVISGEAEMLFKDKHKDKDTKDSSKVILEQSKRVKEIIERLLQFSRRREFKLEPTDINDVVKKSIDLLTYQTKKEDTKIIKKLEPGLPEVPADAGQLQEVFLNIMLNAVQAMKEEKSLTITIHTEEITIHARRNTDIFKQGQRIVSIEFKDTGKGMDQETLKRVFDPFFTTKEENTGLGLSISYSIIQNHNGTIEANSKLGEGATFVVKLPVSRR